MYRKNRRKLNKTEVDILKIFKKINREVIGFSSTKITKNKKKYKRIKYKYNGTE